MINFVEKRKYYYLFSGILVVASIISLLLYGLKFSIDFIGGSEFTLSDNADNEKIENIFQEEGVEIFSTTQGEDTVTYKIQEIGQEKREQIESQIEELENVEVVEFQTIGPVIGEETKNKAIQAVSLAVVAILGYVALVFHHVARPVASWKFGVAAVIALVHDVLLTIGVFSILGAIWGVEVDPLFITAVLTVMGFSVHDTIVTFDRIRENLRNNVKNIPFETVINNSIIETLTRSINTSMTVLLVLVALLLFGGESIRWFTVALTVGIIVGVYSSIFIAAQLLVTWYEWDRSRKN